VLSSTAAAVERCLTADKFEHGKESPRIPAACLDDRFNPLLEATASWSNPLLALCAEVAKDAAMTLRLGTKSLRAIALLETALPNTIIVKMSRMEGMPASDPYLPSTFPTSDLTWSTLVAPMLSM